MQPWRPGGIDFELARQLFWTHPFAGAANEGHSTLSTACTPLGAAETHSSLTVSLLQ